MKKFYVVAVLLAILVVPTGVNAQRRGRPGSMKHTEAEAQQKKEEIRRQQEGTKISCKYISNNHLFEGPVYITGTAGGIKIGDAVIIFSDGRYNLSFDAAKFNIKHYPVMTDSERIKRGISKYEYENSWDYKKLGQDFEYGGKYATIEQDRNKWLVLYNGDDTNSIYAKIPINSVNDTSFELNEDDMLVRMKFVR